MLLRRLAPLCREPRPRRIRQQDAQAREEDESRRSIRSDDDTIASARFHRILRRGREYGEKLDRDAALAPAAADENERGIHFICLNANIARQFEFVQNTWVNNRKFDGLYADPDPVSAPHADPATAQYGEEIVQFTVQECPVRHRIPNLPPFVTMVGGAYLFMPGIRALEYLAHADPA